MTLGVTVLGLGAIGGVVARALAARELPGLALHSVAASSRASAEARIAGFAAQPSITSVGAADDYGPVVVECLPPALFTDAALPVLRSGRTLLAASVGGLLRHPELVEEARAHGARVLVPSGALGGLDAVRAIAAASPDLVELTTEKPVSGFEQSAYLTSQGIDLFGLRSRTCLFSGPAGEGLRHFPKNVNVVAALSLAGVGAQQTRLTLWADPILTENRHTVRARCPAGSLEARTTNLPDPDNPRTSAITPYSVLACLRNTFGTLTFG